MHRYLIFFVIFLGSINSLNAQDNFTFGACEPGKESCQECYLTLVKELLGNDGNVFNLSYVFTSPVHDEPSAVVVNYHFRFDNDTPDEVDTWFWAQSGAYILHPLFIFQFISLFFGNPKPIYEQVVNVTLNATECYGVQNNLQYMILLTQRVSPFNKLQLAQLHDTKLLLTWHYNSVYSSRKFCGLLNIPITLIFCNGWLFGVQPPAIYNGQLYNTQLL